jgi:hypothetical protein
MNSPQSQEMVPYFIITPFSMFFNIWSTISSIAIIYNVFYVPFSIGLDFEIPSDFIAIDICAIIIILADSILRPFLAIDK